MKIINKFITAILIIIQVVSLAAFADNITIPDDVKGTNYEQSVRILLSLNLIKIGEDGAFAPDSNITRAEFAEIIIKTLGLQDIGSQGTSVAQDVTNLGEWEGSGIAAAVQEKQTTFKDVPQDYWAANYIKALVWLKIMSGYDEENFAPEKPVTYDQAVAIVVKTLGYDFNARQQGGYPTGYMMVAGDKKVTKDVVGTVGEPLKRGEAMKLMFNALSVDIMEQVGYGDESKYSIIKDKTLLSQRLKVTKAKGIVTAVPMTGLVRSDVNSNEGYVEINGEIYNSNGLEIDNLLGQRITYYYKENLVGTENMLLCIDKASNDNVEVSFDNTDFNSYQDGIIKYNDKDKQVKLDVFDRAPVIYNGVYYDIAKNTNFDNNKSFSGNMKLLDSDNDGTYDVVFVTSYRTYVVTGINLEDKIVYRKDVTSTVGAIVNGGASDSLMLDESGKEYLFFKDGKASDISSIKTGSILSVAESANTIGTKWVTCQVSTLSVKGKIDESSDDEMIISGVSYKLVPSLQKRPLLGSQCTVYLDINNRIASFTTEIGLYDYAYMITAAKVNGLSDVLEIQMFTKKNQKVEVLKTLSKVILNDGSSLNADKLLEALKATSETPGTVKSQLVAYSVDDKGAINKLYTAKEYVPDRTVYSGNASAEIKRYTNDVLSTYKSYDLDMTGKKIYYGAGAILSRTATRNSFDDFLISKNGIIFDLSSASQDDWLIRDWSYIKDTTQYTCNAYNISAGNLADIMVIPPATTINNSAPFGDVAGFGDKPVFISKISQAIDKDGNQIYNIEANKYGTVVKYTIDAARGKDKMATMKVGDCWEFETTVNNKINKLTKIFDYRDLYVNKDTDHNLNALKLKKQKITSDELLFTISGVVKEIGDDALYLNTGEASHPLYNLRLNQWGAKTTSVCWFDCSKEKLEMKTTQDISVGDLLITVGSWGATIEIMVLKNFNTEF